MSTSQMKDLERQSGSRGGDHQNSSFCFFIKKSEEFW